MNVRSRFPAARSHGDCADDDLRKQDEHSRYKDELCALGRARRRSGRMTAHFVSHHLACVTFLIDKHRSSGQNSLSECIRTRQLDAALLNVH